MDQIRILRHLRAVVTVVIVVFLAGISIAAAQSPQDGDTQERTLVLEARPVAVPDGRISDYRIGRQDLLEIRVFGVDELSQTVRVAEDGSFTMPLVGRMLVAGKTKGEVESLIEEMLAESYVRDPQVTVFIKEYESTKVAVSGAVRSPGSYEMLGRKTLLEMLSTAGGLDDDPGREIFIIRRDDDGTTRRIGVDLERLVYHADPALNVEVIAGDIVYVPTVEMVRIFVTGAVRTPGKYEVPQDAPVTALKAITLAGGTTDRAAEKQIQIMRYDAEGNRVIYHVNLRRIKRGKAEDPVLQEEDVVLVPEAFF